MVSNSELWRMANEQSPIQPTGPALAFIIVSVVFLALSFVAVSLRVWSRAVRARVNWGWDDTFSVLSLAAYTINVAYVILACCYGLGSHDEDLNEGLAIRALLYYQAWEVTYAFSIILAKTSIGVAILRIAIQRRHRRAIWTLLLVSNTAYVAAIIWALACCPRSGMPKNMMTGTCAGSNIIVPLAYCVVICAVVTDAGFAVVPILVVKGLQMPPRRKLTVMAVLGMGSIAAVSSVARLPFVQFLSARYGTLYMSVWMPFFSVTETGVAIVFGCLPAIGKMLHLFRTAGSSAPADSQRLATKTFGGTPMMRIPGETRSGDLRLTPHGKGKTSTLIWSENRGSMKVSPPSDGILNEDDDNVAVEMQYLVRHESPFRSYASASTL